MNSAKSREVSAAGFYALWELQAKCSGQVATQRLDTPHGSFERAGPGFAGQSCYQQSMCLWMCVLDASMAAVVTCAFLIEKRNGPEGSKLAGKRRVLSVSARHL